MKRFRKKNKKTPTKQWHWRNNGRRFGDSAIEILFLAPERGKCEKQGENLTTKARDHFKYEMFRERYNMPQPLVGLNMFRRYFWFCPQLLMCFSDSIGFCQPPQHQLMWRLCSDGRWSTCRWSGRISRVSSVINFDLASWLLIPSYIPVISCYYIYIIIC